MPPRSHEVAARERCSSRLGERSCERLLWTGGRDTSPTGQTFRHIGVHLRISAGAPWSGTNIPAGVPFPSWGHDCCRWVACSIVRNTRCTNCESRCTDALMSVFAIRCLRLPGMPSVGSLPTAAPGAVAPDRAGAPIDTSISISTSTSSAPAAAGTRPGTPGPAHPARHTRPGTPGPAHPARHTRHCTPPAHPRTAHPRRRHQRITTPAPTRPRVPRAHAPRVPRVPRRFHTAH
jgi:hypothetical protein